MKYVPILFPLLIVVTISILSILPLFQNGFFPIHDNTQVARVFEMKKALTDGMFPVRIVPDLGYGFGYPIFNFYAPLSYYLGAIFMFVGLSALSATKLMIGVGMILSGIGMYLLSRLFIRAEGAITASLLYVFLPYHAVNLYVRGAVGELFAFAFLPFAFYGLVKVYRNPKPFSIVVAALGLAGVILSHNLTALMLLPFYAAMLLYFLFKKRNRGKSVILLLLSSLFGVLLAAFYWIPAIFELGYTSVSTLTQGGSVYSDHFVCLPQLWSGQWGFGGSAPGCLDGMSYQVGKLHLLFGIVSLLTAFFANQIRKVVLFCLLGAGISLFMLLPISRPIWDMIQPLHFLQFPWRYLQFAGFFLSLASGLSVGYILDLLTLRNSKFYLRFFLWLFCILSIPLFYSKYFLPQKIIVNYPDQTEKKILSWTISKISDEYLPVDFVRPQNESEIADTLIVDSQNTRILSDRTGYFQARVKLDNIRTVGVNKAYFPAWKFEVDGQNATPTVVKGRYALTLDQGESVITGKFISTPIEKIGNLLSLVGFGMGILGILYMRKKRPRHAKTS